MMHPRLSTTLLALVLSACASHEGPATSSDPTPEAPRADVKVAIASVQLIEDCPDPPDPTPAADPAPPPPPAMRAPDPEPVPGTHSMQPPAAAAMAAGSAVGGGGGGWPGCTQSTVQLSLSNTGAAAGQLRITDMRLLEVRNKRPAGKVVARKPQVWHDDLGYRTWDERIAAGQTLKVAYRIGEPDRVAPSDRSIPEGKTYVLEIDVAVDGRTQTVRSAEFVREPIYMIVT